MADPKPPAGVPYYSGTGKPPTGVPYTRTSTGWFVVSDGTGAGAAAMRYTAARSAAGYATDRGAQQQIEIQAKQRAMALYQQKLREGFTQDAAKKIGAAAFYDITGGAGMSPWDIPKAQARLTTARLPELPAQDFASIEQSAIKEIELGIPRLEAGAINAQKGLLSQQVETYNAAIAQFNAKYGNRALSPEEYKQAIQRQAQLQSAQVTINTKQAALKATIHNYNAMVEQRNKQAQAALPTSKAQTLIGQTAGKPEGLALMYAVTTLSPSGFLGLRPGIALAQGKPELAKSYLREGVAELAGTYGEPHKPKDIQSIVFGAAASPMSITGIGAGVGGAVLGGGVGAVASVAPKVAAGTNLILGGVGAAYLGYTLAEPFINPNIPEERKITESAARLATFAAAAPLAVSMYKTYYPKGYAFGKKELTVKRATMKEYGISERGELGSTRSVAKVTSGYKVGVRRLNLQLGHGWVGETKETLLTVKYPNYLTKSRAEGSDIFKVYELDTLATQAGKSSPWTGTFKRIETKLTGGSLQISPTDKVHYTHLDILGKEGLAPPPYGEQPAPAIGRFLGRTTEFKINDALFSKVQQVGTFWTGKGKTISVAREATYLTSHKSTLLGGGLSYAQKLALPTYKINTELFTNIYAPPEALTPPPLPTQPPAMAVKFAPPIQITTPKYKPTELAVPQEKLQLQQRTLLNTSELIEPRLKIIPKQQTQLQPPLQLQLQPSGTVQQQLHKQAQQLQQQQTQLQQQQTQLQQQLQLQLQQQLQEQQLQMQQLQLLNPFTGLEIETPPPPPPPPPPGLFNLSWETPQLETGKYKPAFKVLVKSKGEWRLKGEGLPIGKALTKGVSITGYSPARSFKLVQEGVTKIMDVPKPSLSKYYSKKGTLIERTKFAIDQPGEFRGITLKGIQAKKFKTKRIKYTKRFKKLI